ncbi:MAG TPA: peptidylprolyl isomerase [Rhodocyclaceae bacterium]|nr:peptidylprolyl isomerase [Rhodocyclaceae bacterium]HMV52753.1 peptidylprolyl isomerase [Rhodocyclaceae bacterium]HMZ84553.1 peptidylprolyl isomerase [Rhodocyclaceae bacterium]HNA03164.1 peptidylprolyl isomerase [Rhodocyclaceae bacterium]HNB79342.1 peptidylprolyl isomerase [Rhodocyclaceae bacterium]
MKSTLSRISLVLLAGALSGAALAQNAKPAAAAADKTAAAASGESKPITVNGVTIPKIRGDALFTEQLSQGIPDSPELRNAVKEELIRREILVGEARKKNLDKNPILKAQADLAQQAVLIRAYMQDFVRSHPVSDADAQKEYDAIKSQLGSKEYKTRHILVDKEDDAKAIIAKLQKGEKFDELAKQSKDPGSKDKGGDLGWSAPSAYVKPFGDALTKLEKGAFTPMPVKSDFGYHVIKLEDVRDLKVPTFEETKGQIAQRLQQKMVEEHIMSLRKAAKVTE